MKPISRLCLGMLGALLLAAPLAAPARAEDTVRTTATLRIYDGPGQRFDVIGTLRKNARVALVRCTRTRNWCLFKDEAGDAVGWVRGGYLVGAGALLKATPFHFLVNPRIVPLPPSP